jgi:hypothetical protein
MHFLSRLFPLCLVALFIGCEMHSVAPSQSETISLVGSWRRVDTLYNSIWEAKYEFLDSTLLIRSLVRIDSAGTRTESIIDSLHLRLDKNWQLFRFEKEGDSLGLSARITGRRLEMLVGEPGRTTYHRIQGESKEGSPWIGTWGSDLICGSHYCDYDTLVFKISGSFRRLDGLKMPEPEHRFVEKDGLIRVMDGDSTIETMAPLFAGDSVRFLFPGFSCGMDGKCQPREPILLDRVIPE